MFHCDHNLGRWYEDCGWTALPNAITLIGDENQPAVRDELLMMLFLSEKAAAHRTDFENIPFYFGDSTW
jgi:hypothetical protein